MNANTIILLVLGALMVFVLARQFLGKVAPATARSLVQGGARLVDVRSPGEFAGGHLPGAVNIPVDSLPDRLDAVGDRGSPVVIYCASGARSGRATSILKRAGFTAVHDLGAMHRWGPVDTSTAPSSDASTARRSTRTPARPGRAGRAGKRR